MTVSGITVGLSNTGKVLFDDPVITKGDLVGYYRDTAARMLPHLQDRPLVMARYPDGIRGPRIFQKNIPGYFPSWVSRVEVGKQAGELCQVLADNPARNPDLLTTQQRRAGRGDRVYSDIMRNSYAQTAVAPFSVRARPGAPVATPLWWQELADQSLTPHRFTLRTVGDRLQRLGTSDPWAGMGQRGYSLDRAARRLEELVAHEQ